MDPFEILPEEIHEDLLRFFNVTEVIDTLSFVSKTWYDIVASSKICLQKTKLNLRSQRKTDFSERIETLRWMSRKGGRGYKHLQMNCLLDEEISKESWNFLDAMKISVETINIRSMKLDERLKEIFLPNLEELKLMFVPREAMDLIIKSGSNLKILHMRNEFPLCYDGIDYTPSESTIASIKQLVQTNEKLEELELQGRPNFLSLFQQDLSEFVNFHLTKLIVKIEMSAEKVLPLNIEHLIKFLIHQSASLKHVYIDSCGTNVIKHVFNQMPEVNFIRFDIELREPNKFVIKDLEMTPNEKITQLELPYIALFDDLKEFLDLAPNLEEILVGHANPRLLEYIGKNLPKLKLMVYRYDDCAGTCELSYTNMRRDHPDFNQNIKFSLCNDFL